MTKTVRPIKIIKKNLTTNAHEVTRIFGVGFFDRRKGRLRRPEILIRSMHGFGDENDGPITGEQG
jgi:hypothetical protein